MCISRISISRYRFYCLKMVSRLFTSDYQVVFFFFHFHQLCTNATDMNNFFTIIAHVINKTLPTVSFRVFQ
jgi:hypothetical protein